MDQQAPKQPEQDDLKFDQKDIDENKVIAALSYLGILVFIPLLAKKDSKFAQAHAKQGVVMFIAMLFGAIPFIGWLWAMVLLVVEIIAIIKTLQGQYWKIPGAYDMSKKFKI
ncbi:MAG: hypothetical protein Q8P90_03205 [bacterium]|nr:hypothetical protein [bacterium]